MIYTGLEIVIVGSIGPILFAYFFLIKPSRDQDDQKGWLVGVLVAGLIFAILTIS